MAAENAACITCFRKVKRLRLPFDYGASPTYHRPSLYITLSLHLQAAQLRLLYLYTIVESLHSLHVFVYGPDRDPTDRQDGRPTSDLARSLHAQRRAALIKALMQSWHVGLKEYPQCHAPDGDASLATRSTGTQLSSC